MRNVYAISVGKPQMKRPIVRSIPGKGIYIRTLCQKNEGSVEAKQRPTKMGGRITYWTLPPKRTPFQTRIDT
jgi:hypothetical protein